MKPRLSLYIFSVVAMLHVQISHSENWSNWRGPNGNGTTAAADLPTHWSPTENVIWKVKLPERGNSSPIVWGDQIFITQSIEAENKRSLICFDIANGDVLWQKSVSYTQEETSHDTNPYCSSSPVTDGERVIVWYGSAGVYCYDMDGNTLWQKQLGEVKHMWGYAASPVIYEDVCFIHFGPGETHFLAALDKNSGDIVWKNSFPYEPLVDREDDPNQPISEKLRGSWSTPLLIENQGQNELVLSLPQKIAAYHPENGEELWFSKGIGDLVYASPVWGENAIVAMGGYHSPSVAFRVGGTGDITDSNRLWRKERSRLRLGTGVIHDGYLYTHDMGGIAECINLKTGDSVWLERLQGEKGSNESWSSMLLHGDHIYLNNKSGDTFIYKANPTFKLIASNTVEEDTNSSLAVSGNHLLIRTFDHLWCIGKN